MTLRELLRPGLRAVVVGINPSLPSVAAGHYYQGRLGRRLWGWLVEGGVVGDLPVGAEDDGCFAQGIGFADLVRVPSATARHLSARTLRAAAPDLVGRLRHAGVRPPTCVAFAYVVAHDAAAPLVVDAGYPVVRLPGFYAPRQSAIAALAALSGASAPASGRQRPHA